MTWSSKMLLAFKLIISRSTRRSNNLSVSPTGEEPDDNIVVPNFLLTASLFSSGGSDSFAIDLRNLIKFSGKDELFENEVDAEVLQ